MNERLETVPKMRVIRSFLALKLNLSTTESLSELLAQLKASCAQAGADIRWVPPPNIHVTLRFLGQITEPMSHAVRDMLEPVVTRMPAFELTCRALGAFPDIANPRVIFADLGDGAEVLADLYSSVYNRLLKAGFSFEDKPFHPHVTLGRVKYVPPGTLEPIVEEHEASFFGTSLIRHFYCYQSDLTPRGAEYTAQWVLPFKRPLSKPPQTEPSPTQESDSDDGKIQHDSQALQTPQTGE